VLKSLRLVNFRGFIDFTLTFSEGAYLVGPNNAGKSTLLTAIRLADALVRFAYRRRPDVSETDRGIRVVGYPISLREFPALRDSIRYEFGTDETRLELTWRNGARLDAVWPDESDEDRSPFFYLTQATGAAVRAPVQARASFPALGVIPILGPAEHTEKLLDDAYVKQNVSGRLSSRHFRNQLIALKDTGQLDDFLSWAEPWMGDLTFDDVVVSIEEDGAVVRAFFYEGGSRVPKEVVWAGDGIQVWLQLLLHIHRVRDHETVVLDEPEVYLHPDLQRRLIRLLESTDRQIVVATHSSEMVAESDGRLTVLIDRSRRRAVRPRGDSEYEKLSSMLGTAFNLRLAKALRSRVVVFVEGRDMSVIRRFASTLRLAALENEQGVTVLPLNGYSNWQQVEPFQWLTGSILPEALTTFVVLDRDYRSDGSRADVMTRLREVGVNGHVWMRKELESYLITPAVIARISGASERLVQDLLAEIVAGMETDVFSRMLDEQLRSQVTATQHAVSVMSVFKPEFDRRWAEPEFRLSSSPPKQILAHLNDRLQATGHKAVSVSGLARAHRSGEIDSEVVDLLSSINLAATSS